MEIVLFLFSVTCCRDKYPSHLLSEWDRWNEANSSENDRPGTYSCRLAKLAKIESTCNLKCVPEVKESHVLEIFQCVLMFWALEA